MHLIMERDIMFSKDYEVLKEQFEALKHAFNSSYDGIHILDKNGYTLMINEACERIEGISAQSIGNKNIKQLVEEGYFSESVTLKVLEKKSPITMIQKVKNGNEVLVTGMPIYKNEEIDKVIVNSRDITELNNLKREILENKLLVEKYHSEWQKLNSQIMFSGDIVFNSELMNKIITTSLNVAKVDSTILITGESGTGKGLISKFIHDNSLRKNNSFVKIDCSTIPETLFESELFGYEKGTFTGADVKGKIGLVQLADEGTLFLDEIGEVPLAMQAKLLRLIQDKEIIRVGGNKVIPVSTRIIAATNRDLPKMVKECKFREDLYYRLNVIPIHIPSLRERREDIHTLVLNLIKRLNNKYGTNKSLSIRAMDCLIDYDWPGNVRELENLVERVVILSPQNIIEVNDLPEIIRKDKNKMIINNNTTLKGLVEQYEKDILEHLLLTDKLTIVEISKKLHVDVTTIRRKLQKHKLKPL